MHDRGAGRHGKRHLKDNDAMTGIWYVTDAKGRRVAVQIDLKKIGNCGKTSKMFLSPGRDAAKNRFRWTR